MRNRRIFSAILWAVLCGALHAADLATWPGQYKIAPWESSRLTAADVVGPDGIVYPDFTGVGVTGGIPDVNNAAIRATYTSFNVKNYGAVGDGVTSDDDAVAAAATAARNHLNASSANKAILYFPTGIYVLDTPVAFAQSNLVIDGDGPATTIIKLATDTAQSGALFTLSKPAAFSGYLTVTAFTPRGTNTLTLSGNPATNSFAVGSWVRLHQTVSGAGKTMSDRFSNPDNGAIFTDPFYHTARVTYAKVNAINSVAKTVTLDRTFTHDSFVDESPQLRRMDMMEYSGVQDLTIETVAATATVNPVKFDGAANCWIKNIKTIKARDWPIYTSSVTRFEVRDCQFLGTWIAINQGGGVAYLGWCDPATDSLMENCQASDLRHMAIFQLANRCVVRDCTFTGQNVQSPQLHGRFPHENLIEGTTFNNVGFGGASSRGVTSFGSDGGYSTVHGVNGPRNVYYRNQVLAGMGSANFSGISEGFIFVYNRILKNEDTEAKPPILAQDRTFDFTLRGNIFQAITTLPALSINEGTCTGWSVTDNKFYGTNGFLYEGDSEPAVASNNRFFPIATTPDAATAPEVLSIYTWQKTNANTARLVVVADRRTVADTGATTTATVVRVKASTASALSVALSADIAGLTFPASVVIPAGEPSATFTITGANVSGGEKLVTLTASAAGLLADIEKISVLDQDVTQPNFGGFKWPAPATGLPANWKAGKYGIATPAGSQSYNSSTATWTITGAGVATETFHGSLVRSGRKFVYQTVDGDGEIRARITSATGEQQTGLMMADDEATHTDFIWVEPNGRVFSSSNNPDNGLGNGVPFLRASAGTRIVPCWLRLKRTGSIFTAYRSTATAPASEADWTVLATVNLYTTTSSSYKSPAILDQRMHYGMFINSGSAANTATATFTNVENIGAIEGVVAPGTPSAFVAVVSGSSIQLSWTDTAADETGFQIESRVGAGAWQLLASPSANATTQTHANVLDGVAYSYRIRSIRISPAAVSPYSNIASATPPATTAPVAPSSLTANALSTSEVELAWTDNAYNETAHELQRATTAAGPYTALATLGAGTSGYTNSGLPEGSRYYYRLRATNGVGPSAFSNDVAAATVLQPPASAYAADTSAAQITLAWTDASAAETGYAIERRLSASGGTFAIIATTGPGATSHIDATVAADTSYLYRVRAINAVTQSAYTGEILATAAVETFAPFHEPFSYDLAVSTSAIGQFGSARGTTGIWTRLAGNNPVDALQSGSLAAGGVSTLGNHLRLGETAEASRIAIALDTPVRDIIYPAANATRTFWLSFLCRTPATLSGAHTPGLGLSTTTYEDIVQFQTWSGDTARRFSIAGTNLATVNSVNSTVAPATSYLYVAKITIGDTNGNAADGIENVAATVWQFPSGSTPPAAPPLDSAGLVRTATAVSSRLLTRLTLQGGAGGAANAFLFDELRIGKSYAQVALTTPAAALGRPLGVTATALAPASVRLRWLDNANAETGYQVERRTGPDGPWANIGNQAANTVSRDNTPPDAAQEYFYRVRAVDTTSQGKWSEPVAMITPGLFTDPATLAHTQPAGRFTAIPVTFYNRASVPQTFSLTAASGGSAYALSTSAQPGGPVFNWTDISATGTALTSLNGQDDTISTESVPIGFSFPFFGSAFTTFRVSTNGWLSFDSSATGGLGGHFENTALPNTSSSGANEWLPPGSIALLWDDLFFQNSTPISRAYYRQTDADTLVLQFSNVALYSDNAARLNLQVHLKRSGDILIYYKDGSLNTHSYTIGLQNANRTQSLQAAFNTCYVFTNLALRFRPPAPWLTISPTSLTVPAGKAAQITATLNSTGLAAGTSNSFVRVLSDQARQPAFELPVALTVSASANPPQPPSALNVSGSPSSVVLTWTDLSTNETGFEFQRSADQTAWQAAVTRPANTSSATDVSGVTGTAYYRVRATGTPAASPWSTTASITFTGLEGFRSLHGLTSDGSADLATPANDGITNLLKYALNMIGNGVGQVGNLTTPNLSVLTENGNAGLPVATMNGAGKLTITYIRRKGASNPGIAYTVEYSSDLTDAWAANPTATESLTSLDATFERVTVTDSAATSPRFVRVKVSTF